MFSDWKYIEKRHEQQLALARNQLHHAVQIPAMFGRSFSPQDSEDQYGNLGWSPLIQGFVSCLVEDQWQAALFMDSLKLVLLKDQNTVDELDLLDHDLHEMVERFRDILNNHGFQAEQLTSELPYQIPHYNPRFSFHGNALYDLRKHLSYLFSNADLLLTFLSKQYQGATSQRTWPHHFDLASLWYPQGEKVPSDQSIGWGFSPGDDQRPLPYFYVNCWPQPQIDDPPALDHGQWNLQGWTGTVLPYQEFASLNNQQVIIRDYFTSSIDTLKDFLV